MRASVTIMIVGITIACCSQLGGDSVRNKVIPKDSIRTIPCSPMSEYDMFLWKSDSLGECGYRRLLTPLFWKNRKYFIGMKKTELIRMLGKPNEEFVDANTLGYYTKSLRVRDFCFSLNETTAFNFTIEADTVYNFHGFIE